MYITSSLLRNNMSTPVKRNCGREDERGAALITAILVSLLILSICGTLLLTTTTSTTNTIGSTDEMQAYYAAEAGIQAALNVVRGNVAPHPSDGTKMNFKNAVAVSTSNNPASGVAQLSRWLVYDYTAVDPARVTLSPGYTPSQGMAYSILGVNDPDNSAQVIYSTSGSFAVDGVSIGQTMTWGSGPDAITLTYTPQASTDITTNGNPAFGSLLFGGISNSKPNP